jgi:hypothetical protein
MSPFLNWCPIFGEPLLSRSVCSRRDRMDGIWLAVLCGTGAVCALLGFVAYLRFLTFIVKHTGNTKGLRDAAIAARAFPLARVVRLAVHPQRMTPLELGVGREEIDERVVFPLELEEPTESPVVDPLCGGTTF